MKIVCDIDGVLTKTDEKLRKELANDDVYYAQLKPTRLLGLILCFDKWFDYKGERDELLFLTGRYEKHRKVTDEWLRRHDFLYYKLTMYPDDRPKSSCHSPEVIAHKAEVLTRLKADFYIEDNECVASALSKLCPETTIILLREM